MNCPKCGKRQKKENKKCIECGFDFTKSTSAVKDASNKTPKVSVKTTKEVKGSSKKEASAKTVAKKTVATKAEPKKKVSTSKDKETVKKSTKTATKPKTVVPVVEEKPVVKEEINTFEENAKEILVKTADEVVQKTEEIKNEIKQEVKKEVEKDVKTGAIRKNIKEDARSRISNEYLKATALGVLALLIINVISDFFTMLFNKIGTNAIGVSNFVDAIFDIVLLVGGMYLSFALIASALETTREKELNFKEILLKPIEKMDGILRLVALIIILTLVLTLVSALLMAIPVLNVLLVIALIVLFIYYIPVLSTLTFMYLDDKQKLLPMAEMFKKSCNIVNGHRVEFYAMEISFLGWELLSLLTFGILDIYVKPYTTLAGANLYERWIKEKRFNKENSGLSNLSVICIGFGLIGITVLLIMIIVIFAVGVSLIFR